MNQFDSNSSAKKPLPSIKKVIITWVFVPVVLISAALLTWHAQSIHSAEEMQRQQTATGLKRAIDSYYTDEHTIHQGGHDWGDILHAVQHQFDTEVAAIGIGTPDRIILSGRDGAKITLSKFIANHFKQVDHFKWDAQTYWLNDLIVYMPIRHPDLHAGMSQPDIDYHLFAILSPKNYADSWHKIIEVHVGLLLFISLFTWFVCKKLIEQFKEPLETLSASMRDKVQLPTNLQRHFYDELATVTKQSNHLLESIRTLKAIHENNIDEATDDLKQSLELIESQNIELELARKQALEASRVKSAFLTNISHEIRTPMNGMIGFTNLLRKTKLDQQQHEYLNTIHRSAFSLLRLIDDILDLSKLESEQIVINESTVDWRKTCDEVLTQFASQAHEKEIQLIPFIYNDIPKNCLSDAMRIKQIMTKLISNAMRLTDGGHLIVRAMLDDNTDDKVQVRITITDCGERINESEREKLFSAFEVMKPHLVQFNCTELSLVVAKKLVECMSGQIGISALNDGATRLWFTLPCKKLQREISGRKKRTDIKHPVAVIDQHPKSKLASEHILSAHNIKLTSLEATGVDGQSDLAAILYSPDDFSTPSEDILETLKRLQSEYNAPVILLANKTEQIPQTLGNTIHHCQALVKPVNEDSLIGALNALVTGEKITALNQQVSVLAVDDNPANLKLIVTLLKDLGVAVTGAENSQTAVEKAATNAFDLIIMDLQLPDKSGVQTAKIIHDTDKHANTPIVALTAHHIAGEREAVLAEGLHEYLTKPVTLTQLQQLLARWTYYVPTLPDETAAETIEEEIVETEEVGNEDTQDMPLDWSAAMKIANQKEQLAKDMLSMLVVSMEPTCNQARYLINRESTDALIDLIHKFHGATSYCGVRKLKSLSQQLEKNLRDHGIEGQKPLFIEWFEEMQRVKVAAMPYVADQLRKQRDKPNDEES